MSQASNGDVVLRKVEKAAVGLHGPKALATILQAAVDSPAPLSAATLFDILRSNGSPALDKREQTHLRFAFGDPVAVSTFAKMMIYDCLNARRRAVVRKAFAAYQESGSSALALRSDSSSTTGSAAADSSGFGVAFETELSANQSIPVDVFTAYYAGWSLFRVRTDDDFERVVLKEWNCDPHLSPRLHETERDWSSTGGTDPLAATPQYAKDALSQSLGRTGKDYDSSHMQRTFPPQRTLPLVLPDYVTTTKRSYPRYTTAEMRNADPFAALQ